MLLTLLTENRTLVLNLLIAFSVLIFRAAGGFDLVNRTVILLYYASDVSSRSRVAGV